MKVPIIMSVKIRYGQFWSYPILIKSWPKIEDTLLVQNIYSFWGTTSKQSIISNTKICVIFLIKYDEFPTQR